MRCLPVLRFAFSTVIAACGAGDDGDVRTAELSHDAAVVQLCDVALDCYGPTDDGSCYVPVDQDELKLFRTVADRPEDACFEAAYRARPAKYVAMLDCYTAETEDLVAAVEACPSKVVEAESAFDACDAMFFEVVAPCIEERLEGDARTRPTSALDSPAPMRLTLTR